MKLDISYNLIRLLAVRTFRIMREKLDIALDIIIRSVLAIPRAISFYRGSIFTTLIGILRIFLKEGVHGIVRRVYFLTSGIRIGTRGVNLYDMPLPLDSEFLPKVSVIVPNYNHARFLKARLDSIYAQTYTNFEVILLDDCSSDNSIKILQDYASRHAENTVTNFNTKNSGGVFQQWKRGLELASGELVWIAESDDECSNNFLKELVKFFANSAIMLAFAKTEFIKGDTSTAIWTQEDYLADLGPNIWQSPFVKSAMDLVRAGWCAKNLAPNVSGVIFRNPRGLKLLDDPEWQNLRLCGDWVFYLNIIRGGLVGFNPAATNYYRQHDENTSVLTQKTDRYYQEIEIVAKKLAIWYPLSAAEFKLQDRIIYSHWRLNQGDLERGRFNELYSLDRIKAQEIVKERKPHIALALYAICAGGGETFPILLANYLWKRGYAVTVINFRGQPTEDGVRSMLAPQIPLVELYRVELIGEILTDLGVEVVHSHHAYVDVNLATFLIAYPKIKHIITLHGMYDTMENTQISELLPKLERRIDAFVYTATKNLSVFPSDFQHKKTFVRIDNALPPTPLNRLSRIQLGLADDDFILCMVARAIPEKGWEEAIMSVILANTQSSRKIQLLLIGAGPEKDRLEQVYKSPFVHFLGFKSNIRDYYSIADLGVLLSRFKGESAPLVLIDCLLSGRPMLASAIGEIPYMLGSQDGLAGVLVELDDWKLDVEQVAKIISDLANNSQLYNQLLQRVPSAANKFDIETMVDQYENIYRTVLDSNNCRSLPPHS